MQRKSGSQEPRKRSEFDLSIPGLLDSKFVSYHCETSLGVDKFGNEGAGRLFAKIGERTLLDDPAFIHEHNFVPEISGFGKIVRDQKRRLSETRKDLLQILLQRRAHKRIERAQRFVEQE